MNLSEAEAASGVAIRNGQFLGLDNQLVDSDVVILPIPWDVTTSYRPGTVNGPLAVIEASYQLDLFSPYKNNIWNMPLHTLPISEDWVKKSQETRELASEVIDFQEAGNDLTQDQSILNKLEKVNAACNELHNWSEKKCVELLAAGKKVVALGGDHSVSLGPIKAAAKHYNDLSILHFDAHADLRKSYEGFQDSHASIMWNVLEQTPNIKKLVQVGIRDVSAVEIEKINTDSRIKTFFDWETKDRIMQGESWAKVCQDIISNLSQNVYISFDIDGLDPKLCPSTGTPVPGGLDLHEAIYLIREIQKSGRKLVGADLVEVAPSATDEWDGNVGARLLFQILIQMS